MYRHCAARKTQAVFEIPALTHGVIHVSPLRGGASANQKLEIKNQQSEIKKIRTFVNKQKSIL
jgi:hypothetical protein